MYKEGINSKAWSKKKYKESNYFVENSDFLCSQKILSLNDNHATFSKPRTYIE